MSFGTTRFVLIDDTDPRITYEPKGEWTPEVLDATAGYGIHGPAHNHTLMRLTSSGSFSFKFNGSSIGLQGTIDTVGRPRPSWTCTIDNKSTEEQQADDNVRANHQTICDNYNLGDGEHTFTFRVTVPSGGVFWFDRLHIRPLETILAGETLYISEFDPSVSYTPRENFADSEKKVQYTNKTDSFVTFSFNGTSVSLFSIFYENRTEGKAHWVIDDQPPIPVTIPGQEIKTFYQELVHVANLSATTNHTLVVTYDGQPEDTPLSVDFFVVTLPPKDTPGPSPDPDNSTPVGAIVGGVVGGVAFLVLVLVGVFFIRRRRRNPEPQPNLEPVPFVLKAELPSTARNSYDPYATGVVVPSVTPPIDTTTTNLIPKQRRALEYSNQPSSGSSGSRTGDDIPPPQYVP